MIELINRKTLLGYNKKFGSQIVEFQNIMYNPLVNGNFCISGEVFFDDEITGEHRLMTQKECDDWNKEASEEFEKNKDVVDSISIKGHFKGSLVFSCQLADAETYISSLANSIRELSIKMNWGETIFILNYSTPWLYQQNNYAPVSRALEYFKSIGVKEEFNGGFKVGESELSNFIKHLFWIIRCNASLPYCYFSGGNTEFVIHLCKYGDIHFDFYSDEEKIRIQRIAKDIGMIEIKDGECQDNFSNNGSIEGRQIIT